MLASSLVLLSGLSSASAASSYPETFERALSTALATSPALAAARADRAASAAGRRALSAQASPQLRISIQASQDLDSDSFGPRTRDQSSLLASINLYSGGRVRNAVRAARLRAEASADELRARTDDLRIGVALRYDRVLDTADGVAIEADQVSALEQRGRAVASERDVGVATHTDSAIAGARLALARARLAAAEGERDGAGAAFREVVGVEPGVLAEPPPIATADLDGLVVAALGYSPSLKALEKRVAAAAREVEASRGLGRPTLSFVASANYGNTDLRLAQIGRFPHRASLRASLSLTVPLYQGGQVTAQIASARAGLARAEAEAEAGRRSIVAEVAEDHAAYRGALRKLEAARDALAANRAALDGVRIERAGGTRITIDVLDAEREVRDSARAVARSRRLAHYHGYALMVRTGGAPPPDAAREASGTIDPRREVAAASAKLPSQIMALPFDLAGLAGSRLQPEPAHGGAALPYRLDRLG